MKWAVQVAMRDNPPGDLHLIEGRINVDKFDLDIATGAFSWDLWRGTVQERRVAVRALAWLADLRAVSPLLRAVSDSDFDVRWGAGWALSTFSRLPSYVLPQLDHLLAGPDRSMRHPAVGAIAAVHESEATDLLLAALADDEYTLRLGASMGLLRVERRGDIDRTHVPYLLASLEVESDRDTAVVISAILRELGVPAPWTHPSPAPESWEGPDNWFEQPEVDDWYP